MGKWSNIVMEKLNKSWIKLIFQAFMTLLVKCQQDFLTRNLTILVETRKTDIRQRLKAFQYQILLICWSGFSLSECYWPSIGLNGKEIVDCLKLFKGFFFLRKSGNIWTKKIVHLKKISDEIKFRILKDKIVKKNEKNTETADEINENEIIKNTS